jgi:predicted DNA-binding transcriptional regulator AlpA
MIDEVSPGLLLEMNAFMSEKAVIKATSLSRTSLHRKRLSGEFPEPEPISEGRMAYRIRDVQTWLDDPQAWSVSNRGNSYRVDQVHSGA